MGAPSVRSYNEPMRATTQDRVISLAATSVPAGLAAALIPLRGELVTANVALLLVVTVVAFAGTGRRLAAAAAPISAFVGFNLFHTLPYYSLRIDNRDDVETALLLLVVGLVVGELALRGRRARFLVAREREDLASMRGLGAMVAEGEAPDYVMLATASELMHLLALVDCRFERDQADGRPLATVQRDGTTWWGPTRWETERWGFPRDGVAIPVLTGGRTRGRFVLTAPVGLPLTQEQLVKAVALVDQAGAALAASAGAA